MQICWSRDSEFELPILSSKVHFSEHEVFNSDVFFVLSCFYASAYCIQLSWDEFCSVEALSKPYSANKDPGGMYFDEA